MSREVFLGGLSSSIAGGNFWDGFKQGVITSGLNHLAHAFAMDIDIARTPKTLADYKDKIEAKINKRIDKINERISHNDESLNETKNPNRIQNLTNANNDLRSQLVQLNQAKTILNFLLSREHDFNISLSTNVPSSGDSDFYLEGTISWGDNNKSLILNFNGATVTIIHEMVHLYDIIKGNFRYTTYAKGERVGFYSYDSEINAYKIHYSVTGNLDGINYMSEINKEWLKNRGYGLQ